MILIDTSAWIEFLKKSGNSGVKRRVADLLDRDEAAYTCPVSFELLVGARGREIALIQETLSFCERRLFDAHCWDRAAELEQKLKQNGVTVPRDDVFVATVALEEDWPILCRDKHFDQIRTTIESKLQIEQYA